MTEQEARLRTVEQAQAAADANIANLAAELPRMEARLVKAIEDSRPKNQPGWAMVAVAAVAVVVSPVLTVLMTR